MYISYWLLCNKPTQVLIALKNQLFLSIFAHDYVGCLARFSQNNKPVFHAESELNLLMWLQLGLEDLRGCHPHAWPLRWMAGMLGLFTPVLWHLSRPVMGLSRKLAWASFQSGSRHQASEKKK